MNKLIKRLGQLESEIESGIRSVGKALMEIRDSKAYPHDTFEAYCKERWGFTDRHARDLIDAEAVRVKIGSFLPVETLKTQHLVAISKVPPAKQAQVAASVIAECQAENREPTTKDYKAAAKEFVQPKVDPKPEPKDGSKIVRVVVSADRVNVEPEPKDEQEEEDDDAPTYAQTQDHWEDVDDQPSKPEQAETPQAKPEPSAKERAASLKSIVKQHNAAMMRAIDDLHGVMPNKLCRDTAHKSFRAIHEVVEAWR